MRLGLQPVQVALELRPWQEQQELHIRHKVHRNRRLARIRKLAHSSCSTRNHKLARSSYRNRYRSTCYAC